MSTRAWGLYECPKSRSPAGTPPIAPASVVSMIWSLMPSSATTLPTSAGMPTPRLRMAPGRSSMAERRAITLRSLSGIVATADTGIFTWPEKAGL